MVQLGGAGLAAPLLGKRPGPPPLTPLYVFLFIACVAHSVGMMPAFGLRFRHLAADAGLDAAETAATLGKVSAFRSMAEFFATPALAFGSDHIGRRPVMMLRTAVLCLQFSILAASKSLWAVCAAYIVFGLLSDSNGALESACVADATPAGVARAVEFGRVFTVIGAAIIVGPAIGGYLVGVDDCLPFKVAALLFICSFAYVAWQLPEYLRRKPGSNRNERSVANLSLCSMLETSPGLLWYISATTLCDMGMGAFGSVQVLWLREAFGLEGRGVGMLMSASGLELMVIQSLIMPRLLKALQGREAVLAQLGACITAMKLVAYAFSPSVSWIFVAQVVGALSTCALAPLRSLCTKSVPESHQGALSGAMAAISTAAGVVGGLVGSHVFAASLRSGGPLGRFLLVGALCYFMAAMCICKGACADTFRKEKLMESP